MSVLGSLFGEVPEGECDFVDEAGEVVDHFLLGLSWILEFHLGELDELRFGLVEDDVPCDFGISLGLDDGFFCALEVVDNTAHHADGFVEGACVVIVAECVLLQEIFSDDFSDFECEFLVFGEGVSTDKLDDFVEFCFFVEDFFEGGSKVGEVGVEVVEVGVELAFVVGCGDVPVD